MDAVKVTVYVKFQKDRGMVRGSARSGRIDALETQNLQVQLVDKDIDDPHRVVFADIVIKAFGQQRDLLSVLAFDESLHAPPRSKRVAEV